MPTQGDWIDTTGGPHVVLAEELLNSWRGIEGWYYHRDPDDMSDYARACRIGSWLGVIPCAHGHALVLSGDVGPIKWVPYRSTRGGMLVQWLAAPSDRDVDAIVAAASDELFCGPEAEEVEFLVGGTGSLRLFDSSMNGRSLAGNYQALDLAAGTYRVRAACLKTTAATLVVREMRPKAVVGRP